MGKIIVKNIKGMGWKTRIGLIMMFTLVFSVLIYQGLRQSQDAYSAVSLGTAWSNINATAPGTALPAGTRVNTTSSATYTAGAGSSRLLLVSVYYELATASTATFNVTYGGVTATQIATSGGVSNREHVWIGYVKDASIPAGAQSVVSGITCATASTLSSQSIKVATYVGVDQATPTSGSNGNAAATSSVASNAAVSYVIGGKTIVAHSNGGSPATVTTMGGTPTLTVNSAATNTTNHSTYIYESATHTSASNYASGNITVTYGGTTSARSAIAIAALRPATTTLANGAVGTSANVAPGSAGQKLDGFSFQTATAGSTDSITGLTVTTTNQAAIASMQIWDEAGTTQYFATVNNPGSNTWAFSGGTPIPVTNTASNYKVLVTYKTRAGGAPAGNTTTTANVTAFTGTNIQAGTDTADTTLTLLNTHAASTWGTNSVGNASVTLNWSYGTVGQSVVIIRYTANTDTTKPVDGTSYGTGSAYGTGGTVRYVGNATTFTDSVGLSNGVTYYYKIFEYDTFNNYYNASDVWTTGLVPTSPDSVKPTVNSFTMDNPVNTLNIPVIAFTASDNVGGSGMAAYMITTSATPPAAGDAAWTPAPPTQFTVAGDAYYTLYPWAKDAAGNVSLVYATPANVTVDTTLPTVSTFTVTAPSISKSIAITSFTADDSGTTVSGVFEYIVTTSATPPDAADPNWATTAPTTFTVATDGTYTLYPWVKDYAGNISAAANADASKRTLLVDSTPPAGLALVSPPDIAVEVPTTVALTSTTATDASGGVMYWFKITNAELGYIRESNWQAGTSFSPSGLLQGYTYIWTVKAKDANGLETAFATSRSFTTTTPCVPNEPTVTLLSTTGGTAGTISTDSGTLAYNLKVINNDYGGCSNSTFNLSVADTNSDAFLPSTLGAASVVLGPGQTQTTTVTVRAKAARISGTNRTTASVAADPAKSHSAYTTPFVQTTLNVVGCTANVPLFIVGPDSGYLNKGGQLTYTISVKNSDTGAGCSPVVYTLAKISETNSTDFNASQFTPTTLTLNAGQIGSATVTVSAKTTAARNSKNTTTMGLSATGHTAPANLLVVSTVNNPMLHNSDNTISSKWAGNGGWGLPGTRYGEITCETCHTTDSTFSKNIRRVRDAIFTPVTSTHLHFPGEGQPVNFRRVVGNQATDPVLGWDAGASPRTSSSKVCEICHTYDATGANGTKAHPYATTASLPNHYSKDGLDCIDCHKHNKGFKGAGGHVFPFPGQAHKAGLTAGSYGNCTGCHSVTAGGVYPAVPAGDAPNCTGCHANATNFNSASAGCADCHGSNTDGRPSGSTFPDIAGSHNLGGHNLACATCHEGAGTDTPTHGSQNRTAKTRADVTVAGAAVGTWNGSVALTCSTNNCHGTVSPVWGNNTANATCTKCHGTPSTNDTNANRAPSVGAHQEHVHGTGSQSYGRELTCFECHNSGTVTTFTNHMNGNKVDVTFANASTANANGHTATWTASTYPYGNCSVYCHGAKMPLGDTSGTARNPSWINPGLMTGDPANDCGTCHGNPPSTGATATTHQPYAATVSCTNCHLHFNITGGFDSEANRRLHIDGKVEVSDKCDVCHGYQVGTWASKPERSGVPEGKGAHEKHIAYLLSLNGGSLDPVNDLFGSGTSWTNVCGVCHSGAVHSKGEAVPGTGRTISISNTFTFGSAPQYNGVVGTSSSVNPKNCSNVSCHFTTTPVWSTY